MFVVSGLKTITIKTKYFPLQNSRYCAMRFYLLAIMMLSIMGCTVIATRPKNAFRTITNNSPTSSATGKIDFIEKMNNVTSTVMTANNKLTLLTNGYQVFPAMLSEISKAKTRISLETYIFRFDSVGNKFYKALVNASKRGVKVRFLCDSVGSKTVDRESFFELLSLNGEVRFFNPVKNWTVIRLNNRDHRKILVIDGKVAFLGGLNYAEEYDGDGINGWRDTAIMVNGRAAIEAEKVFQATWNQGGRNFIGKDLPFVGINPIKRAIDKPLVYLLNRKDEFVHPQTFEVVTPKDKGLVRVVSSAPDRMASNILDMYLLAINSAHKRVWITSGYFIPPMILSRAIIAAAKRGVDVCLITQGRTDEPTVRKISIGFYGKLIGNGVKVYEWKGKILHAKTMLVDDNWATIGSANLDGRALFLNYEANVAFISKPLLAEMIKQFKQDLRNSQRINLKEWKNRGLKQKTEELLMYPLESQF